jgi:hypothetical protein
MTTTEMKLELTKTHDLENAAEIAAELAEIATKKAAKKPKAAKKAVKKIEMAETKEQTAVDALQIAKGDVSTAKASVPCRISARTWANAIKIYWHSKDRQDSELANVSSSTMKAISKKPAAKKSVAKAPKKEGPTSGILALLARRKNGATTAEIHAAFPTTKKSDVLTRLTRKGLVKHLELSQWAITPTGKKEGK